MSLLDRINKILPPRVLARNMVKARAGKYVEDFVNGLGEKRITWMIQTKRPFSTLVKPEDLAAYREAAGQWAWAADAITDREFFLMLPPWAQTLITSNGQLGLAWWAETTRFMRGLFRQEPVQNALPPVAPPTPKIMRFTPVSKSEESKKEAQLDTTEQR